MRRVLLPHHISPGPAPAGGVIVALDGLTMGTSWSVRMVAPPASSAELKRGLQQRLDDVVAQMSHWDASSDLGRYNRAPADSWHALAPDFFTVLDFALDVMRDSGGAYDPCAGALVNLWGFGPEQRYDEPGFIAPTQAQIGAVRERRASGFVGHRQRLWRRPAGGLSGIAGHPSLSGRSGRRVARRGCQAGWPTVVGGAGTAAVFVIGRYAARRICAGVAWFVGRHIGRLPALFRTPRAASRAHHRSAQRRAGAARSGLGDGGARALHGRRRMVHRADRARTAGRPGAGRATRPGGAFRAARRARR